MVVYEEISGGTSGLVAKIYNPATNTYSAQFAVLISAAISITDPDIAVLSNGNYVVIGNVGGADSSLAMRIFAPNGANVLGAAEVGNTLGNAEANSEGSVTALAGGGFVVAWTNTDFSDTDVQFSIYNNAGTETGSGSVTLAYLTTTTTSRSLSRSPMARLSSSMTMTSSTASMSIISARPEPARQHLQLRRFGNHDVGDRTGRWPFRGDLGQLRPANLDGDSRHPRRP